MKYYVTVDTKSKLLELVNKVKEASAIAIDTETTSLNVRTGKIIGVSFTTKVGEGYYIPTLVYNSKTDTLDSLSIDGLPSEEIAKQVLNLCHGKKLIAHNASYDLRIIKNYFGIDLLPSLWIETLLLVHTVMEEGAFGYGGAPFALKTLAKAVQEEIGLDVEKEANQEQVELKASIVKNGGSVSKANYELYKADLEVLSKYACADTDLTFRIAKLFLNRLADEGLDDFFFKDEVMPLYKEVTIPMEERGVRVDLELLNKTKADIEADLASNKKRVIDSLLAIPEARLWILEQAHIKFPPSRRGSYAQKFAEVYKEHLPLPVKKDGKIDTSKKAILNLPDSPYKDFLLNPKEHELDKSELLKISSLLWKDYNEGEYINIQSKKHLGEIVFDKMNIGSLSKTKKGKKQFDDEFVEHLSKTYEWANNLRIYNRLLKIKSTYVDRFLERHENGRYYFYYKQHGTVSGRYGSDAQQLPKPKEEGDDVPIVVHYNNTVRKFLIADEDKVFVDCDYESLEPHVFASVSNDPGLQDIFAKGHDFYSTVAIRTENLQGVSADKSAPNFLKKVDANKRNSAKAYSLGIAYGMGEYALGMTLGIPTKEAAKLIEGYLSGFPELRKWREDSRDQMKNLGFVKSAVGRVRHLTRGKDVYDAFGEKILNWQFRRKIASTGQLTKDEVQHCYRDLKNALNSALNFQIQSLAASVVNRAAIAINRELKKRNLDGLVIAQIHDQLVVSCAKKDADEVSKLVQDLMENTTKLKGVTLKAPPEIALNLCDGH